MKGMVTTMTKQIDLKELLQNKMKTIEPNMSAQKAIEVVEQSIPKNLMFDAESTDFKPETRAIAASGARGLTVEEAKQFDDDMNRFIDAVLISGIDYGVIPHCNKPTLLKSGAEKILNYLGLIARTEVVNRVEDYNTAFFSYECKVFLLDYNGVVKGEGVGITNTREGKYAKQNGFSVQNVVLKMSKKRALVDAVLNVGNLSARFTQDIEDMSIVPEDNVGRNPEELSLAAEQQSSTAVRKATAKQIDFLERLMKQQGTSPIALNKYVNEHYNVCNYKNLTGVMISELIDKFRALDAK